MTGYFRKFIKDYALKSKPLSRLLLKDAKWEWTEVQQEAFDLLKQALISAPVLAMFDPEKEIRLYTDASRWGLAGILVQVCEQKENVVAYFSRQTTNNEQKYHSFELEALAIVASVKKYRQYLLGREFKIITDCAAVKQTFSKSELNTRIGRWVLALSEYNYTIIHRQGALIQHVDALSRNPVNQTKGVHLTKITLKDWLVAAQCNDKEIQHIKSVLELGDKSTNGQLFIDYELKSGAVYRKTAYGCRWVVPKAARYQVLRMSHDDVGHFAFAKTYELVKSQYWFQNMRRFIKKYIQNCLDCIYFKNPAGKLPGQLHPIAKIARPFHTVHIDHLGPFVKSRSGNTHILAAIDAFTKFILLYAVRGTHTKHTIKALKDMIQTFGAPKRIISDRATSFTSEAFKNFCQNME